MTKYMSLPLKTILFDKKFILVVFILLHVFLFNINEAEWGDSYRMLRASEFIKKGAYPADEKRPPLFPFLLALKPNSVGPIFWGRSIDLVVSVLYFLVFSSFLEKFIKDKRFLLVSYIMFIFNPVFLYWSIRIMSDVPFAFFSLLAIYWLCSWERSLDFGKTLLLGFLAGLSVFLRFEGYLLSLALLGGILLNGMAISKSDLKLNKIIKLVRSNFVNTLVFLITFSLTVLPFWIFRNPLNSAYIEETSGRTYDLKTVWIYLAALFFSLGFIPALYTVFAQPKSFLNFFSKNISITFFVSMELLLILFWPAAIPRLFVSVIPLLIIPTVLSMKEFFSERKISLRTFSLANGLMLVVFVVSQYFLKQQFLVPQRWWFILLVCLQIPLIIKIFVKDFRLFCFALLGSLIVWSMSPIYLHKDTFISVKRASQYVSGKLTGIVAYNDVSGVSDWYINHSEASGLLKGYYYDTDNKKNLTFESLKAAGMDYLIITNEHNTTMTLDLNKRPYLEEIVDFRYNISGKLFFAKVIKVNKGI